MLIMRVQLSDYSRICEFVFSDRNGFYTLAKAFELDPTIKGYSVIAEGKQLECPYKGFGFHESIKFNKFVSGEFEW